MSGNPADSSTDASATLVVFCRRPRIGVGKSRLAAELGAPATHELAGHLWATTLEDARSWNGPVVIAPAEPEDVLWAESQLSGRVVVVPQPTGNLGERINAVDKAVRRLGHSRLVFIGSDAPALTPGFFARARGALDEFDIVLGPADDGGVTLMASNRPWPDLAALPWSGDELADALERCCRTGGQTVERIDPLYDVDRASDLERLEVDLQNDARPARRALADWLAARRETTVSVVVPVLGDAPALRELFGSIRHMPQQPKEIIVVDGGDDRNVAALCRRFDSVRLRTRPGRGHQLHAGALRASGDVLWFLHADAIPAPDSIRRIRERMGVGAAGGYFRFRFAGPRRWYKSLLETLINLRCRIGVPYGDQGLFFARSVYEDTQGFVDAPLFEEVPLVRAARKAGSFDAVDAPLGVSPRRWERDGWLRRTLHNRLLAFGYMLGVSSERLARRYVNGDDERPARC